MPRNQTAIVWALVLAAAILQTLNGCGNARSKAAIENVMKLDSQASFGASSVAPIVDKMRSIDLTACPNDFREAYVRHIHAWELALEVENEIKQFTADNNSASKMIEAFVRGFFFDLSVVTEGYTVQKAIEEKYRTATAQVQLTYREVEQVAVRHGVALQPKTPSATTP